jgi:hypothetical protein
VLTIREGCETTADMILPHDITNSDVSKAIASLSASIELISRLLQRLVGEGGDKDGKI